MRCRASEGIPVGEGSFLKLHLLWLYQKSTSGLVSDILFRIKELEPIIDFR